MKYYPIAVNLSGREVLVVGGGKVAERKIDTLLESKAKIKVVSPEFTENIERLAKLRKIVLIRRKYKLFDIKGAQLIITATNDKKVNKEISRLANKKNILVNVVDNSSLSNFISPAIFHKGKAIITVYSDGKDPVLSRDLKNFLKEHWGEFLSYRDRL